MQYRGPGEFGSLAVVPGTFRGLRRPLAATSRGGMTASRWGETVPDVAGEGMRRLSAAGASRGHVGAVTLTGLAGAGMALAVLDADIHPLAKVLLVCLGAAGGYLAGNGLDRV